jgi:polyisoprenoid-binding protein YceI
MQLKTLGLGLAITLATSVTLAAPVDYKIDPTHTATVFSWNHFGFSTPSANFTNIQGVIKVDNEKPANSSVEVTIPLSSVNTNVAALDKEFQEEAWFNAAKYPNITFKSTKVEPKIKSTLKLLVT